MASSDHTKSRFTNIWQYIDPTKDEKPGIPTLSSRPHPHDVNSDATKVSDLTASEVEDFMLRMTSWWEERSDIQKIERRFEEVQNKIMRSVPAKMLQELKGEITINGLLLYLDNRYRPSSQAWEQKVIRKWNNLRVKPRNGMILSWLDQWNSVYAEAKELKLSQAKDPQAQYDFLYATKQIDAAWSDEQLIELENDIESGNKCSSLQFFINEFRHLQKSTSAFSREVPDYSATPYPSGAFTTNRRYHKNSEKLVRSKIQNGTNQQGEKECLCGLHHRYEKCFYINYRNTHTPKMFKFNPDVFRKIDENLKQASMKKLRNSLNEIFGYEVEKTKNLALNTGNIKQNDSHNSLSLKSIVVRVLTLILKICKYYLIFFIIAVILCGVIDRL